MGELALVDKAPVVTFEEFWAIYPRRVAKRDAIKAWAKLDKDQQLAALIGLADWRKVWIAKGEMEFVPYPATWLNGWRWEDELPASAVASHPSQIQFKPTAPVNRAPIPADVLAKIKSLRAA